MKHFADFYRTTYPKALALAERRLGVRERAEDVVAEAYSIALDKYSHGHSLDTPWLYAIVRNVIGNEYQRQDRQATLAAKIMTEKLTQQVNHAPDIDVIGTLARLSEDQQSLLEMTYWDELNTREVAAILGIGEDAVRARLTRARRAFALALRQPRSMSAKAVTP